MTVLDTVPGRGEDRRTRQRQGVIMPNQSSAATVVAATRTNHPFVNDMRSWSDARVAVDAVVDCVRVYYWDGDDKGSVDLTLADGLRLLQHLTASIDALRTVIAVPAGAGLAVCANCPHAHFVHDGEGGSCTRLGCPCTLYRFPAEDPRPCDTPNIAPTSDVGP